MDSTTSIHSTTPDPDGDATGNAAAVVLAAGKGTRMKSDLPKVLCQVADRPMVHFVLDALSTADVDRHIVVVGYRADDVRAELSDRQPSPHFVEQTEQLGTGHAVAMCRDALADVTGPTIVLAGDSPLVQPQSITELLSHFAKHRPALLLGTLQHQNPEGLGRIVRDESGEFLKIVEHKDATDAQRAIREVNLSTYVFDTPKLLWALEQLSSDNAQNEYYLTDCAEILRGAGHRVEALPCLRDCEAMSINNPDQLAAVDQYLRNAQRDGHA